MRQFDDADYAVYEFFRLLSACGSAKSARMGGMQGILFASSCSGENPRTGKPCDCTTPREKFNSTTGKFEGWVCNKCQTAWGVTSAQLPPGMIENEARGYSRDEQLADLGTLEVILSKLSERERRVWATFCVGDTKEFDYDPETGERRHRYEAVALTTRAMFPRMGILSYSLVYELISSARKKTEAMLKKKKLWGG